MTAIDWAGLAAAVRGIGGEVLRAADPVMYRAEGGFRGSIRALPPPAPAAELMPIAVLRAETLVPAAAFANAPPVERLAQGCNRLAGMAAARAQKGGLAFHARATLFAGDEAFWPTHAQLLAYAGVWGPATALQGMRRLTEDAAPDHVGASAWTPEDLDAARNSLPAHLAALLDPPSPHVLAATVPLPGRPNRARLEVRADVSHPLHGKGLMAHLALPVQFPTEPALRHALALLNAFEAEPIDAPPHYGAWAAAAEGRVAYSCFLPSGVKLPVVQLLAGWLAARAPIAAAMLGGGATTDSRRA